MDIEAGNACVEAIRPLAATTRRSGSLDALGGFGALFDPKAAGFEDPVLVAATDGVGTKLRLAFETGIFDTVGIDLVAMCVNDVVVQGAEPLFFLDYFAAGGLEAGTAGAVIRGITQGCRTAGCALIGGETAEMPGFYASGEFDLAGFAVGAAERGATFPRADRTIEAGDVVIGLASSGVHSNGFSLVRKIVEQASLEWGAPAPFDESRSLGDALLTPTRIYVRACLDAAANPAVKGFAHITGGGLVENIPRALPAGFGAELDAAAWRAPEVFGWLQAEGGVSDAEMARTFNCGIGMVVIAAAQDADEVAEGLADAGAAAIGRIVPAADRAVSIGGFGAALGTGAGA